MKQPLSATLEFVISPAAFLNDTCRSDEATVSVPERVPILADVVLPTGVEHTTKALGHVILGLPLVDYVVRVDDARYSIKLVVLLAVLTLYHLTVIHGQLLVLDQVRIEVKLELAVLTDLIEAQWPESLPHF